MSNHTAQPAPQIHATWPMVASVIGAVGTIGIATAGGLLLVILHLDGQQHSEIQDIRKDVKEIGVAVSANTALLRQLLEAGHE